MTERTSAVEAISLIAGIAATVKAAGSVGTVGHWAAAAVVFLTLVNIFTITHTHTHTQTHTCMQIWHKTPIPATKKFTFWGDCDPKHYSLSSKPPKGISLGESASFNVYIVYTRCIHPFLL